MLQLFSTTLIAELVGSILLEGLLTATSYLNVHRERERETESQSAAIFRFRVSV